MNVALNITSIPAQEAFLVDAPTPTSPNPRWIQAKKSGGVLLSQGVYPQVPSALASLTSVFGMGTGVASSLSPPETGCT